MKDSEKSWTAFWEKQSTAFNEVMRISTDYFARQFVRQFKISAHDEILDYGSGPGFLADSLASLKVNFTGADINPFFVQECKKNHPDSTVILITPDPDSNQAVLDNNLGNKRFDYIVLLSISQYLENPVALERIIAVLKRYLGDKGKIVIADVVDPGTSALRDLIAIKFECIRRGKITAFVRFFFYLVFSNYRKLSRNVQLLRISGEEMNHLAQNVSLRCERTGQLTVHPTRTNYILTR